MGLEQWKGGRIVSVAAIIAVDVSIDGRREIIGLKVGPSEAETFWLGFLKILVRRGPPDSAVPATRRSQQRPDGEAASTRKKGRLAPAWPETDGSSSTSSAKPSAAAAAPRGFSPNRIT